MTKLLTETKKNVFKIDSEQQNILLMLKHGRFDYILLPPEEFEHQTLTYKINPEEFTLKKLYDIPPGNKRYLIFSKDVGQDVINAINGCLYKIECEQRH